MKIINNINFTQFKLSALSKIADQTIVKFFRSLLQVPTNYRQKQPPKVFYKKAVLKNFAMFTGKHLCWTFFLVKLQTFR